MITNWLCFLSAHCHSISQMTQYFTQTHAVMSHFVYFHSQSQSITSGRFWENFTSLATTLPSIVSIETRRWDRWLDIDTYVKIVVCGVRVTLEFEERYLLVISRPVPCGWDSTRRNNSDFKTTDFNSAWERKRRRPLPSWRNNMVAMLSQKLWRRTRTPLLASIPHTTSGF